MGTDIHGVFQRRTHNGWEDVPSKYDFGRHYFLFGILANVRNGTGFAGVKTGDPMAPIAMPRGLPKDFELVSGESDMHPQPLELASPWRQEYHSRNPDDKYEGLWMGDHSFSWLSADEILAYADARVDVGARRDGVISIAQYRQWDGKQPESWSGGIWGGDIVVDTPATVSDETTHVQVSWVQPILEEIGYFIDEVRRLKAEHGDVRMVFGFDS